MYELLNIPRHKNCRNCGECCSLIPATKAEVKAIQDYIQSRPEVKALAVKQSNQPLKCPFRDDKQRICAIYPVRPLICRLMGVVRGMDCLYGNSDYIDRGMFLKRHSPAETYVINFIEWNKGCDFKWSVQQTFANWLH